MAVASAWHIKLLYDGDCPLCRREIEFLRRRDGGRGLIAFVDIAAPDYDAAANAGIDFVTAMREIHAITADGRVIRGVEVFRQVYAVLGLGWLYGWTGLPGIRRLVDWLYGLWAERRLALTGRPDVMIIAAQRCSNGRCERSAIES
ncbi:thiol-disulfide oxidoreductase DCC family protein [Gloeomargarita sp.]